MDVDGGDRAPPNNTKCAIITMVVVVCVFVVPLFIVEVVVLPLVNGPPDDANLLRVQINGRDFHTQHINSSEILSGNTTIEYLLDVHGDPDMVNAVKLSNVSVSYNTLNGIPFNMTPSYYFDQNITVKFQVPPFLAPAIENPDKPPGLGIAGFIGWDFCHKVNSCKHKLTYFSCDVFVDGPWFGECKY